MEQKIELKINKKLKEVVPKLKSEDYIALITSIEEKGLMKPIDVMADGTIIDGHHRYKACRELKIEPAYQVLENVKTIEDALEYSFGINFARRQLTDFEKMVWQNSVFEFKHDENTQRKIAEKLGMNVAQVNQIQTVIDNSPEQVIEQIKDGNLGWTRVHKFLEEIEKVSDETKKNDILGDFNSCKIDTTTLEDLIERTKPEEIKEEKIKPVKEPELIKYLAPVENYPDEADAEQFFNRYGGSLIGKKTYWVGKILDTYKSKADEDKD